MPNLLEILFHYKNHFISIRFHLIDTNTMLQVFPESLNCKCKWAFVWGIDCGQPNCNPSWMVVNAELKLG